MDFILNRFCNAKYNSALDLTNSFFQIKLSKECKLTAGFTVCNQQFVFERLPQGFTISSAILTECLSEVLTECNLSQFCVSYADDIFVISEGIKQHKRHLEEVLQAMIIYNLKLHPQKFSIFRTNQCRTFGFEINLQQGTVSIDLDRIGPLLQLNPHTTKKELRHIIGSVSYYKMFCPYLGYLLSPLHSMTGVNAKFEWTSVHDSVYAKFFSTISRVHRCSNGFRL